MTHYRRKRGCLATLFRWFVYLFIAYVLFHWLTAGQDEIIEGPPEAPEGSFCSYHDCD
jgi:hypothetical protein